MWGLYMSIIICTFVLSMLITTTGSRGVQLLAEGRLPREWSVRTLPRAYNIYISIKKFPTHLRGIRN